MDNYTEYINDDDKIVGIAKGGGSSIVLFVTNKTKQSKIVRKIWDTKFHTASWGDEHNYTPMLSPLNKGYLQAEYINGLPQEAKSFFPLVHSTKVVYDDKNRLKTFILDQSYIPGLEVSTFVKLYRPNVDFVSKIYIEILRCLHDVLYVSNEQSVEGKTLENSFLLKIKKRIELAAKSTPNVMKALTSEDYIIINNTKYLNIYPLLDIFKNSSNGTLEPSHHYLVNGDTNTQNIKIRNVKKLLRHMSKNNLEFGYKDIGITFLDPRSYGFNTQGPHTADDYLYDSKFFHNSLGNYDTIYGKHFNLNVGKKGKILNLTIKSDRSPYTKSYKGIHSKVYDIFESALNSEGRDFLKKDRYWHLRFVFLTGTHFAAMLPFHIETNDSGLIKDDLEAQKKNVALYCEGIKWLNNAIKIMENPDKKLPDIFKDSIF